MGFGGCPQFSARMKQESNTLTSLRERKTMQVIFPTRGRRLRFPAGHIIQGWGENPELYQNSTANLKFHNGWDIVPIVGWGEDILAPEDGTIELVDYPEGSYGYGNNVILLGKPDANGVVRQHTLGHLNPQKLVSKGQEVKQGQIIAKMGNSGFIVSGGVRYWGGNNPDGRGTHLHWTVKKFQETNETGIELFQFFGKNHKLLNADNGVRGAIDPTELFQGVSMTKFFKVNDHGKLGIMVLEGFTGIVLFEDKMAEFLTLQNITNEALANAPTIEIP